MRTSFALLAAVLLGAGACAPSGSGEEGGDSAVGPDREAGELALVTIVRGPDGACSVRWDGQPIATNAVRDRTARALEALIEQLGGPENIMTLPRAVFEAPEDAPYSCFGGPLDQLATGGFGEIALRFAGRGPGADRIMEVPVATPGQPTRPFAVLDLRADGRAASNGQPLEPAQLREYLLNTAPAPGEMGVSDGSLLVHPEPATPFAALHGLVALAMEGNRQVKLQPRDAAAAAPEAENAQAPTP